MKKVICVVIYITVILLMFSGCQNPFNAERRPTGQINTKWVSEDGTISFYVDEHYTATGTYIGDDKTINLYLVCDYGTGMYVYPINWIGVRLDPKYKYEFWLCDFKSKTQFVATVKETTFFEVGQEITFNRVS